MITSKLLDPGKSREKIYTVDNHVVCGVAGLTADANILLANSRIYAQRHLYSYNEPIPVEQLIVRLCDHKQAYTQHGGLRPFGVSFLFAGWDRHFGFQLYHTDPSGNYSGWKATAVGVNTHSAQSILKQDWREDLSLEDAQHLAAKVLLRTMDSTAPSPDKLEFAVLYRDTEQEEKDEDMMHGARGKVVQRALTHAEVSKLIKKAQDEQLSEQQASQNRQ
eukprot:GHVN01032385.1.p2 GENE.GHVN01032385.1~~GHVN01032385.1.p2  ORF type:complete len:220 (+),score=47.28 GHVN01032385.1:426-1085(+)